MKILITGDDGFVGLNLTEMFLKETDHKIIGLSKKTIASSDVAHKYQRYNADVNDVINLNQILNRVKPDWIIHLAAEADVSRSYDYPYDFLKVNTIGTFYLLEWLKHNKNTKLLYFSTDEVFAEIQKAKENNRLNPLNPYSASKASAEMFINAYTSAFDLKTIIFRPYNIFGKWQKPNRLFSKIITNALSEKKFMLYKETHAHKRGWIYAKNIFYAVDLLMRKGKFDESYNMVADAHLSVSEVKDRILNKVRRQELFGGYKMTSGRTKDDLFYSLDGSKITKLGYKPKFSFDEGLKETINYFKSV